MKGRPQQDLRTVPTRNRSTGPGGRFTVLDGEVCYLIANFSEMPPFLASIPSDTDLWMFIASGGGLTAGRVDAEGSLFPYLTVDQLHDAHHHTGPLTLVRIEHPGLEPLLWEPFTAGITESPLVERNLYKNATGNRIVFEEIHHGHGMAFRYGWAACDRYGWVRSAALANLNDTPIRAMVLDGLRNILPFGAPLGLYQQAPNLVDAYKKSEVDPETGMGIFSLTAGITDRAEAVEVLRANTVWCCGLESYRIHLSLDAVAGFRRGEVIAPDEVLNGSRGNYLISFGVDLDALEAEEWYLAADTGRDHAQLGELRKLLIADEDLPGRLTTGLREADRNLRRYVASADGLQVTGAPAVWVHHFANVLFNNMRGGVFAANYDVPVGDFTDFLQVRNPAVARRRRDVTGSLPDPVPMDGLMTRARETGDADFLRLCLEYLPLHFGRRHGDPSRPWNRFAIRVRNGEGERLLSYEGNWRDIFQNWEALCTAFPGFLPNIVAKFVNASTRDGFNPYRIDRDGVDWESVSPDDPWSNIGYWGDHQIIYLLKLLEAWDRHDPEGLAGMLEADIFSYADVPYRIKPYAELLRDPRSTIVFDADLDEHIAARVDGHGTDGKLVARPDGEVYHANLLEKLLVPALAKLSNLVCDAGIWMNTQRPEWNDANNALAGGGVSVVTLCHLRRYLAFLADLLKGREQERLPVSAEVVAWFDGIAAALDEARELTAAGALTSKQRRQLLDAFGETFSRYRDKVYAGGFSGKTALPVGRVVAACRAALEVIDRGIAVNRRPDGLFHTYNLLDADPDGDGAEVQHLYEMLEGQVAALTSGVLDPGESLAILERLFASRLYRPDQRSFILYPERELPGFLEKNSVPAGSAERVALLVDLLAAGDRSLVVRDAEGVLRFNAALGNAKDLEAALDGLGTDPRWSTSVSRDRQAVLDLYEEVFRHRAYTGRSGAMYGYEGLGCIYWHMVAKLLLAVQETWQRAVAGDADPGVTDDLARMYFRIRAGIGYEKSVTEYGAFPTDPYSHTPASGGAKQPGMTGQVKEEILTRRGELGICIEDGAACFRPGLLGPEEFLGTDREFRYFDVDGQENSLLLEPGSLAFTLCQVPVVYQLTEDGPVITAEFVNGTTRVNTGDRLDAATTAAVFGRTGRVRSLWVAVPKSRLTRV
ncbi:MAG: hypothetical protein ABIK96_11810 [bacterium]